jgi:glutamyl-tRNA reductase
MKLIAVGLNYKTAPIEVREKLTMTGCVLRSTLDDLKALKVASGGGSKTQVVDEAIILSTCNRLEIYAAARDFEAGLTQIELFLSRLQNIHLDDLRPHLYSLSGDATVTHLMQVSCGLDSMILGEAQILGQVTAALDAAFDAQTVGAGLSHLFSQAIHAGKRARTETVISRHTTSVSHAGAALLTQQFPDDARLNVLILGAGEMAVMAAQALQRLGDHRLAFMNRTFHRAEELAAEFGGIAMTWNDLDMALEVADAVVCCTGAPHIVLVKENIAAVQITRQHRSLVLMDIAVPRDVDPGVSSIAGVKLFDIDDLQSVVDSNIELRRGAIPAVERIIAEEVVKFNGWLSSRAVTPVITDLRKWAQAVADEELSAALQKLPDLDDKSKRMVTRLAHRIINRFLHEPTSRLRDQAFDGNAAYFTHVVRELFPLDENVAAATHISDNNKTSETKQGKGQVA